MPRFIDENILGRLEIEVVVTPISRDTYDEERIEAVISKKDFNSLFAVALQFCIVGMGKKSFGQVKINEDVKDVKDICLKEGLIINASQNAKLEPADLTIKRVARFFRFHVSQYIEKTGVNSFLYRKYAGPEAVAKFTFPGAEYLIVGEHCLSLINTYGNVDKIDRKSVV